MGIARKIAECKRVEVGAAVLLVLVGIVLGKSHEP
jgi:hypothetical protein